MYDVVDRRIAKDVDDDGDGTVDWSERYVYDSAGKRDPATGVLLDDVVLVYDESDTLVARYLHGPAIDEVLAEEDAAGDVLWSLADHLGTVRDWVTYDPGTDETTVDNHLTFTAFGTIASQTNGSHTVRFAYTGREWDADAELFHYRARWYDPQAGRFISEDPLTFGAGDTNILRYTGNSPTRFSDPAGLAGDSRKLTYNERQALEAIYLAALPGIAATETNRAKLSSVLAHIEIWDSNTISGWHTVHPWNVIAQNAIHRGGAAAVTLGPNQYYRRMPVPNDINQLALIGHETFHSLHAALMASTTAFLIGYSVDSMDAAVYEGDLYERNLSEMGGHAMQDTINQMLQDPVYMQLFNSRQAGNLPDAVKATIRMRFVYNMSRRMQK